MVSAVQRKSSLASSWHRHSSFFPLPISRDNYPLFSASSPCDDFIYHAMASPDAPPTVAIRLAVSVVRSVNAKQLPRSTASAQLSCRQ